MSPPDSSKQPREPARFAYSGLHRLIHERARLSILTSLASHREGLDFNDLKSLCSLTDGNLSRQLQILGDAGFVETTKGRKGNRPQTMVCLSSRGRKRFAEYLSVLQAVIADANAPGEQSSSRTASTRSAPA